MVEKKESTSSRKKHPNMKKGEFYKIEGDSLKREKKSCPKCGAGTFMADHEKRLHCGNCSYTEFK